MEIENLSMDTQKRVEMDEGLESSFALKPEPEEIFPFNLKTTWQYQSIKKVWSNIPKQIQLKVFPLVF